MKSVQRETARRRIETLFEEAEKRPEYADRYMRLALRLKKRFRLRFTSEQRRKVCKLCGAYLVPGRTCTWRYNKGMLVITCKSCGRLNRYNYKGSRR